jgi:hypothetical protein
MLCGSQIRIWNLANHMKKQKKNIKMLELLVKNWKLRVWCFWFHFFHVICKTSYFNMWTAKHLVQASCTELTLLRKCCRRALICFYLTIKIIHILLLSLWCFWKSSNISNWIISGLIQAIHRGRKGPFNTFSKNIFSKRVSIDQN